MKKYFYTSLLPILLLCATGLQAQIYVNAGATGANDGTSWDDAFTDLTEAIDSSMTGDQIWVAAGTYLPRVVDEDSTGAFFTFPHDLELYGGFAGTETMLSERDPDTNETILSGDHADNDINNNFADNRGDNSYHVMWLTDTVTVATIIDGLTFRNGNTAPAEGSGNDRRGGAILAYGAAQITNCYFTQNYGYFGGAVYPRGSGATEVLIEDCVFENNQGRSGGAIYINSPGGTITNCMFEGNLATAFGGGIYNNVSGGATVSDCMFLNNSADANRGGGVYNTGSPSTYLNCTFDGNLAENSSGGAFQVRNSDDNPVYTVTVMNCDFMNSVATFGGAVGCYDGGSVLDMSNCTFDGNTSANVGGALSNAFGATSLVDSCTFINNSSSFGGALYSQNDSSHLTITNSVINFNTATDNGGAIAMSGDDDPLTETPLAELHLENVIISGNSSIQQAGGLNISNTNATIISTLFEFNVTNEGAGGAISFNASDSITTEYLIMNSTLVNNIGLGAGIGNWEDGEEGTSTLTMQNTIMYNPDGNNYEIEDGDPIFVSNGGNLSTDASTVGVLTGTNDLNETDPLFVDFDGLDYHLQDGSPCVDMGIADGAPLLDLEGNARVGEVDMGAYENQTMVRNRNVATEFGQLRLFPVPVVEDELTFHIENPFIGRVQVRIAANNGAIIFNQLMDKPSSDWTQQLDVSQLPHGVYLLTISNGSESSVRKFIK